MYIFKQKLYHNGDTILKSVQCILFTEKMIYSQENNCLSHYLIIKGGILSLKMFL